MVMVRATTTSPITRATIEDVVYEASRLAPIDFVDLDMGVVVCVNICDCAHNHHTNNNNNNNNRKE